MFEIITNVFKATIVAHKKRQGRVDLICVKIFLELREILKFKG